MNTFVIRPQQVAIAETLEIHLHDMKIFALTRVNRSTGNTLMFRIHSGGASFVWIPMNGYSEEYLSRYISRVIYVY